MMQVVFLKPTELSLGGINATLSGRDQVTGRFETSYVNLTTVRPSAVCC